MSAMAEQMMLAAKTEHSIVVLAPGDVKTKPLVRHESTRNSTAMEIWSQRQHCLYLGWGVVWSWFGGGVGQDARTGLC